MASNALAQMLDELMGRDRNLNPTEKRNDPKWDDPDVCKYYLVDFCPSELFTNTRADLGLCEKIHDDHLRKEYKKSSRSGRLGFEDDFLRYLQTLINDVEKRIRRGHQRLALSNQQNSMNGNPQSQKEEKVKMLTERINELVHKRVDEHIMGKQHSGYARIRAYVEGKRQRTREEEEARESKLRAEREEREKEREREREERRKKEEEKQKEREKEREARKERERERKKRSRSRSRSRRSRSRDRKKRSRSRSRHHRRGSRSRSRDRHHKSSRRHRSRSKDRRRSKDRSSSKKSSKERSGTRSKSRDKGASGDSGKHKDEAQKVKEEPKTDEEPKAEAQPEPETKTELESPKAEPAESSEPTESLQMQGGRLPTVQVMPMMANHRRSHLRRIPLVVLSISVY
ncbi:LC7L3-like protein [Mya arenaria]|uniref:LC7L3-like protein n=1 Tax=Mya arenaria TaxID=6604 RepID=A0ABY7DC29_MYAAR|nr:LC7L3-like protein [Mya arenaria]